MRTFAHQGLRLAGVLLALAGPACHSTHHVTPPVPAPPPVPTVARKVTVLFVDAATGAPITSALQVTVRDPAGNPSALSQDAAGAPQSAFATTSGLVAFQVSGAAALPVSLVVVAAGPGLNGTSTGVTVASSGNVSATASLVRLSAPPPGVGARTVPVAGTIVGGETAAPIALAVSTATAPGATSSGSVRIPAATAVVDAAGATLAGSLAASISYYGNQAREALLAVPGGLVVNTDQGPGSFVLGGLTAVELRDATGRVARTFSQPVEVRIGVPAATRNPTTGLSVAPGDLVPVWSYDEVRGTWTRVGGQDWPLADDGAGGLEAVVAVDHFSWFAPAWLVPPCLYPRPVTVTGVPGPYAFDLGFYAGAGGFAMGYPFPPGPTYGMYPYGVPPGVPTTLTAWFGGLPVGFVDVLDTCGAPGNVPPIALPVVFPPVPGIGELEVHVLQECLEDPTRTAAIGSAEVLVSATFGAYLTTGTTDALGVARFPGLVASQVANVSASRFGVPLGFTSLPLLPGVNRADIRYPVTCQATGGTGGAGGL